MKKIKIILNIRNLASILILLTLASCSEQVDYSSPAQSQIDEYTALLRKCQKQKEQTQTQKTTPTAAEEAIQQPGAEELNDNQPKVPPSTASNEAVQQPSFEITPDDIVLGDKNSRVVVTEYFSPTCPHCAYFKKNVLPEIKKKYIDNNKIAYVIREFISNKQDFDAAILARCNNNKDSFLKFTEVLLEQQNNWAFNKKYREVLTNIGQLGGVSAESYANCLNDEHIIELLISNTRVAAKSPKFVGTPAFFINGMQFTDPYTAKALSKSIEDALNNSNFSK